MYVYILSPNLYAREGFYNRLIFKMLLSRFEFWILQDQMLYEG